MKKSSKVILVIVIGMILMVIMGVGGYFVVQMNVNQEQPTSTEVVKLKELPKPEISGGERGELGIDKNINESTIDEYLNREDSVYRDMRMLEDPGNYEKIGGDRYLSGYVEGFEVIPLPYIMPVTGLPSEVGDTYTGTTLFYNDNGTYIANYEESMEIIERIFPKDKVIFLMCGGGGYSGMTKNFLVSLGWDENKIYNTGGYWYYKGSHSVDVKKDVNGIVSYDFENVTYHDIEFNKLTKSKEYKEPTIKVTELKINTSKIELEEGTSFKLNVIVLPNEATNKEVKWISNNEKIAAVTAEGLVNAIGAGKTTVIAKSIDGDKTISCEVIVNKKVVNNYIKLDDVSKEAKEMASYNLKKIEKEFDNLVENPDGSFKEKYSITTKDGGQMVNDLWREEFKKCEEKRNQAQKARIEIFNRLIDSKKSFVILIHTKECDEKEYSVVEGAEKILKEKNYSYIDVGTGTSDGDVTLGESKLDISKIHGSIAIVKEGKVYAAVDPEVDSLKNEKEVKNWLSKYIDVK